MNEESPERERQGKGIAEGRLPMAIAALGAIAGLLAPFIAHLLAHDDVITAVTFGAVALVVILVWAYREPLLQALVNVGSGAGSGLGRLFRGADRRRLLTALSAFAVVVVLLVGWVRYVAPFPFPGPDCATLGAETPAQSAPAASRADVFESIEDENVRVERAAPGRYVTIAFLGSLRDTTVTVGRIVHELEGAHTAQVRANRTNWIGQSPQIRLEPVDLGRGEKAREAAVEKIKGMAQGDEHLVAVTGMGVSNRDTVGAARALADAGIPMVGDVLTADGLDATGAIDGAGPIRGLFRMPFEVSTQFERIDCYLQAERSNLETAVLVEDAANNGPRPDLYAESLANAFRQGRYREALRAGGDVTNKFGGENVDPRVVDNEFNNIVAGFCGSAPDMVFYAGRAVHLPAFLRNLSQRRCTGELRPLTVVTGSDASSLAPQKALAGALMKRKVSVLYVPLGHPADLASEDNSGKAFYTDFAKAFEERGFHSDHLLDGWAIMAHDAFATAALGAHRAALHANGQLSKLPDPTSTRNAIANLTTEGSVPGATGGFAISSATGDRSGGLPPIVHSFGAP